MELINVVFLDLFASFNIIKTLLDHGGTKKGLYLITDLIGKELPGTFKIPESSAYDDHVLFLLIP